MRNAALAVGAVTGALVAGCGGGDSGGGSAASTEPVDLSSCFTQAGAQIATSPKDLSFAQQDVKQANTTNVASGTTGNQTTFEIAPAEARESDWRVLFAVPEGETGSISEAVENPSSADVVAYVEDASDTETVKAAEDCLDGTIEGG